MTKEYITCPNCDYMNELRSDLLTGMIILPAYVTCCKGCEKTIEFSVKKVFALKITDVRVSE